MEQMEVKSKETPIPNQNEYNDKDILTDVLSSLKSLSTLYGVALQEASNEDLYQSIEDNANKVCDMQRKTFYKLFELGNYFYYKNLFYRRTRINEWQSKTDDKQGSFSR